MRTVFVYVFFAIISQLIFTSIAVSIETGYGSIDFEAKKTFIIKEIKQNLPKKNTIIYTKVPRGIILSISQDELFDCNSDEISKNGRVILSYVAKLLNKFSNNCTVEAHSEERLAENNIYREDWEISIVRATKIAEYLSNNFQIESSRLFPIGFGKIMPFKTNVAPIDFNNNRIDFVIFYYDESR